MTPFPDMVGGPGDILVICLLDKVGVGGGVYGLSQLQNLITVGTTTLKQLVKTPGSSKATFPCHFNSSLNWKGSSENG